jgi:hypothetical protein
MYDLMGLRLSEPDQQWVKGNKDQREAYLSVLKLSRYFAFAFSLGRALSFLAGLAFAFNQSMLFYLRFGYYCL